MKFVVIEKVKIGTSATDKKSFVSIAAEDLKFKAKLEKKGKLTGGPCLDILADAYILETDSLEEFGEIMFNSPSNMYVEREVHPLGSFRDSLEGMKELAKR